MNGWNRSREGQPGTTSHCHLRAHEHMQSHHLWHKERSKDFMWLNNEGTMSEL